MLVQHFGCAAGAPAHQKRHIDVLTTGLPLELEMGVDFGWVMPDDRDLGQASRHQGAYEPTGLRACRGLASATRHNARRRPHARPPGGSTPLQRTSRGTTSVTSGHPADAATARCRRLFQGLHPQRRGPARGGPAPPSNETRCQSRYAGPCPSPRGDGRRSGVPNPRAAPTPANTITAATRLKTAPRPSQSPRHAAPGEVHLQKFIQTTPLIHNCDADKASNIPARTGAA